MESKPGQGSTFGFTATFGHAREKEKRRLVLSPDLRGLKVLVVDDNPTSREIFQKILESFSFEVTLAAAGEEGLAELESTPDDQPFELVIMDWRRPGLDGIETSRRIKEHPHIEKKPAIVMVTAYGREEVMRKAERTGLDGFLIKPVSPSVLFDTIMQAFGKEVHKGPVVGLERDKEARVMKSIQGARVLLVEDNEINRQVAREILEGAGLAVSMAGHGREAIDALSEGRFDAVLMDVQMPVMDGYEATRVIRSKADFKDLPIIALQPMPWQMIERNP